MFDEFGGGVLIEGEWLVVIEEVIDGVLRDVFWGMF